MTASSAISRSRLLQTLNLLRPGLANKEIFEGSTCFNFHRDIICTYNDFFSVVIPFETGVEGAVQADELYKLLDKMTGEEVEIIQGENEIRLRCGKTKAGLKISGTILPPIEPEGEFYDLPKDYQEGLDFCQFSCSTDMTRPELTCLHIRSNKISSSDNHRITEFIQKEPWPYDFLLPAEQAVHLNRYELTHMALDNAWAHFLNEESGLLVSVRLKAGKSIDIEPFFDVEGQTVQIPIEIKDALERTTIMVEGASVLDLKVSLKLEEGKLTCRGEKEAGWVEETLSTKYSGPPMQFQANPKFLLNILSRTQEMVVGESTCLFRGPNFRHVMMLVSDE